MTVHYPTLSNDRSTLVRNNRQIIDSINLEKRLYEEDEWVEWQPIFGLSSYPTTAAPLIYSPRELRCCYQIMGKKLSFSMYVNGDVTGTSAANIYCSLPPDYKINTLFDGIRFMGLGYDYTAGAYISVWAQTTIERNTLHFIQLGAPIPNWTTAQRYFIYFQGFYGIE